MNNFTPEDNFTPHAPTRSNILPQSKILMMPAIPPATASFWVPNLSSSNPNDPNNDRPATATFLTEGASCLVYLDDADIGLISSTGTAEIANWFDAVYPIVSSNLTFGVGVPPYEGNIDAQSKIVLLVTPKIDNGKSGELQKLAYFFPRDKNPGQTHSAGTELIYVLDQAYLNNKDNLKGALAHELHRMIYYNQKGNEGTRWIEEGLSLLAQDFAGFGFKQNIQFPVAFVSAFLQNSSKVSLNNYPDDTNLKAENIGMSYLFIEYLFEKCGGVQAIKKLHTQNGYSGLNDIINVLNTSIPVPPNGEARLIKFFNDFSLALYCDDIATSTIPADYRFDNISLRTGMSGINGLRNISLTENPILSKSFSILGFTCDVIEYTGGNNGDIYFVRHLVPTEGNFKSWIIYLPGQ